MPRLMVCGSLVLALLCSAPVRAQVAPQMLQPGKPLETELAPGRTESYLVRLSATRSPLSWSSRRASTSFCRSRA